MKQANFKGKQKGGHKRGEFGDGGGGEGEKELSVAGDGQWHGEHADKVRRGHGKPTEVAQTGAVEEEAGPCGAAARDSQVYGNRR